MSDTVKLIIEIPKEIYERCKEYKLWSYDAETLEGAVATSKPFSENKGEWIPANEPPKESGRYLVYIVNEYDEKLQYQMTADYIARPTPIEGLSPWNVDDECASDNVVAWQPLPEPYKAESEDK